MFNNLANKVITVLGIAFKANTNDVRDSSAMYIYNNIIILVTLSAICSWKERLLECTILRPA